MLDIKQVEPFLFTPGDAKKILLFKEYMQSSTVGRVREK